MTKEAMSAMEKWTAEEMSTMIERYIADNGMQINWYGQLHPGVGESGPVVYGTYYRGWLTMHDVIEACHCKRVQADWFQHLFDIPVSVIFDFGKCTASKGWKFS